MNTEEQIFWLESTLAAVSVTQQLEASGFPKAGSRLHPPTPPPHTHNNNTTEWQTGSVKQGISMKEEGLCRCGELEFSQFDRMLEYLVTFYYR